MWECFLSFLVSSTHFFPNTFTIDDGLFLLKRHTHSRHTELQDFNMFCVDWNWRLCAILRGAIELQQSGAATLQQKGKEVVLFTGICMFSLCLIQTPWLDLILPLWLLVRTTAGWEVFLHSHCSACIPSGTMRPCRCFIKHIFTSLLIVPGMWQVSSSGSLYTIDSSSFHTSEANWPLIMSSVVVSPPRPLHLLTFLAVEVATSERLVKLCSQANSSFFKLYCETI